jgi:signal transduction histidine kinase
VWDQGEGLAIERLDGDAVPRSSRTRPSSTARSDGEGFGLGLMIVRRLVEALGYRIEVHTRPMSGTRVRIVIPADRVISKEQA